jgi:hypothetical protein
LVVSYIGRFAIPVDLYVSLRMLTDSPWTCATSGSSSLQGLYFQKCQELGFGGATSLLDRSQPMYQFYWWTVITQFPSNSNFPNSVLWQKFVPIEVTVSYEWRTLKSWNGNLFMAVIIYSASQEHKWIIPMQCILHILGWPNCRYHVTYCYMYLIARQTYLYIL